MALGNKETNDNNKLFSHAGRRITSRFRHSSEQFALLKPLSSLPVSQLQLSEGPGPLFCVSVEMLKSLVSVFSFLVNKDSCGVIDT